MLVVILLSVGGNLAGCIAPFPIPPATETTAPIEAVQAEYESQLMELEGVVGVGIGECAGEPCFKVLVEERSPELEEEIPQQLAGYKVEIEVVGSLDIQGE